MKTYIFALAFSGITILSASAQDEAKRRNDGTYSTHNYKHPNKAAVAQKSARQQGVEVTTSGFEKRAVASYKQPVPRTEPVDGLVVPHTPQENLANRNYKIQRTNLTTPSTSETEIASSNSRPAHPVENE